MNVAPASAVIEMVATRHGEFTNAPHESPSSLSGRICQQWRLSLIVIGIATVVSTIVLYVLTNDARYVYMAAGAGLITAIFAMYVLYHYPYALDIQNALGSLREELGEQQELAHAQSQELRQQTELAAKQRVDLETLEQQLRVQKDLTTQQKQGLASLSIQLQTEQDLTTQQKQKLDALQAQLQDSQALASTQKQELVHLEENLALQKAEIERMLTVDAQLHAKTLELEHLTKEVSESALQLAHIEGQIQGDERLLEQTQLKFKEELDRLVIERQLIEQEQQKLAHEVGALRQEREKLEKEQAEFLKQLQTPPAHGSGPLNPANSSFA